MAIIIPFALAVAGGILAVRALPADDAANAEGVPNEGNVKYTQGQSIIMKLQTMIAAIERLPGSWVRHEQVRRTGANLVLSFGVYKGRRGRRIEAWQIHCKRVLEAKITAMDGGGLALYSSTHPAAREFTAPQVEVVWTGPIDEPVLIGTFYKAHTDAVDDWVPFESYSRIKVRSKDKFSCRGPDFIMRAYASALRSIGKQPELIPLRRSRDDVRPRVLHFGDSYVVAGGFVAQPSISTESVNRRKAKAVRPASS